MQEDQESPGQKLRRLTRSEVLPSTKPKPDEETIAAPPKTALEKMMEGRFPVKTTGVAEDQQSFVERRQGLMKSSSKRAERQTEKDQKRERVPSRRTGR